VAPRPSQPAERWQKLTGCPVLGAYGLSEVIAGQGIALAVILICRRVGAADAWMKFEGRFRVHYELTWQTTRGYEASATEWFGRTFKRPRQPESGCPSAVADLAWNSPSITRRARLCVLLLRFRDTLFFSFLEFAGGAVSSGAQ